MKYSLTFLLALSTCIGEAQQRIRDAGIKIGVLQTGKFNAITDVGGVTVGHTTLIQANHIRTGVTVIKPHSGNIFQEKLPAAIYVGNGFGKLTGITQVKELGTLESPVVLTNTLSVAAGMEAIIAHTLSQPGNENVLSVNALVGETNDGYLNDIRGQHISKADVLNAMSNAAGGKVAEGNVGAGTGTVCFGFKGGIGTASRVLPQASGGYTIGVLVQTNFGGVLQIAGVPVGKTLGKYYLSDQLQNTVDGSCMIIVATDAPLDARNLERLAKRAFMGLAKTGGIASNGSGDYVVAFSTHPDTRILHQPSAPTTNPPLLHNEYMSPLFMAAIEATEEAIINSMWAAESMTGREGHTIKSIPKTAVLNMLKHHNVIQ